jgi:hypothetical protein
MRFRVCSPFSSDGNGWLFNQRLSRAFRWKVEDHQLARSGSVTW